MCVYVCIHVCHQALEISFKGGPRPNCSVCVCVCVCWGGGGGGGGARLMVDEARRGNGLAMRLEERWNGLAMTVDIDSNFS